MMLPEIPHKYLYIVGGFIALVFVANVLLLDFFFVSQRSNLLDFQTRLTQLADQFKILGGRLYTGGQTPQTSETSQTGQDILNPVNNAVCPTSCVSLIALSTNSGRVSTSALISPYVPAQTTTTTSSKGEYFVPLGSGSISQLSTWTDINTAQGAFDTGNYSSIKAFYFEVVMHIPSAQGEVRARLVDTTTPFIYAGEELKTTSGTGALLSTQIPLRSGSKTYKVQMYTTIDTATLDSARIRIVTQ